MTHHENHHEEKKTVNFWAPLIGALVVWCIVLIIETNLDEKKSSEENQQHSTEQIESQKH